MFLYLYFHKFLIAAAVIPALILLVQIYRADRLEKESGGIILRLVLGGIISTIVAAFIERAGNAILSNMFYQNSFMYRFLMYFVVVALAEEGAKYFFTKNRTWRSPEFNCQFDGVVYAVSVALGFALWENINYVLTYGFATAVARALTAIPGHASFGVFMGCFYGLAKKYHNRGEEVTSARYRRLAVLVPALLHGTYDFIAVSQGETLTLVFVIFIVAMFIYASRLVKTMSAHDQYI